VSFSGIQAQAVAQGFGRSAVRGGVKVLACSILPEHVHLVIARHRVKAERIVGFFKGEATRVLLEKGLHPLAAHGQPDQTPPCCWGEKCWKVFLDSPDDVRRAIQYVANNPVKEGKPPQRWSFVTPCEPM
jgi:REP element-mobilizing transposase RayT